MFIFLLYWTCYLILSYHSTYSCSWGFPNTFLFFTVPSLPPQNLWANNISSTALRVTWSPVPTGYVHGILRGYKLFYRKSSEVSASYREIALSPEHRFKEIDDLQKFTFYEIRILAFTIKGDGAQSPQVNVRTDEDSEYWMFDVILSFDHRKRGNIFKWK